MFTSKTYKQHDDATNIPEATRREWLRCRCPQQGEASGAKVMYPLTNKARRFHTRYSQLHVDLDGITFDRSLSKAREGKDGPVTGVTFASARK